MLRLRRLPPLFWPLLVGLVSLAITGWLWQHERQTQQRRQTDAFDFALRQTVTRIEQRMASYEQMLRGTRGLFDASDEVTREDFRGYVDALMGGADFTGLRHLGFARLAPGRDSAPLRMAAPDGVDTRALLGLDALAQPGWRAAMLHARDSGGLAITDRLWTPGADTGPRESSFVMFMPVYEPRQPIDTVALRQARLLGWIVAGFGVDDLMSSLYGEGLPGVEVLVYDGVRAADDTRMYPAGAVPDTPALLDAQEYVGFAGHTWTVRLKGRGDAIGGLVQDTARVIAVAGTGLSLLLALLAWQLVTASERANAAARTMTRQLRDSAERYRRIVDTAAEGIWAVDTEQRTTFTNPKLQALLGWREDELLGRPCGDFLDAEGCAVIAGQAAPQRELRLRRRDGSKLWVMLATTPITDTDGAPAGTLAMVTDVTERRDAEQRRSALEAQLQQSQKMEAIGTLAGGIAHDFNNILAATLGHVALLQQELAGQPMASARLQQIRQASERARSLVQQIVTFSRRQPQALEVQALQPLVAETAALLRSTLPAQVVLDLQLDPTPLFAGADATQLQQVLMNLCTNAWHALRGSTGRIELGLHPARLEAGAVAGLVPGDYVQLWVADDGCGMDEATLQRAFEPFFTTKPVGQGTGLGLAVVHGIVAAHGGSIVAHSEPGAGSRFDIYLPRAAAPQPVAAGPATPAAPAAPRGSGEHLLYVDDDPVMVVLTQELLQRLGYRVSGESDARAALALVQQQPQDFDLVVTDHNMPGLTGLDLARALHAVLPDLPVVITSGYVADTLRAEVGRGNVQAVVQKEYMLEQLGRVVHEALAARRAPVSPPAA